MALFSVSKVFSQIFADVWKWSVMADRERFMSIYNKCNHQDDCGPPEKTSLETIPEEIFEVPLEPDSSTLEEMNREENILEEDSGFLTPDTKSEDGDVSMESEKHEEPSSAEKAIAEKVLKIIENEIKFARPVPKQRETYLRLSPLIPSYNLGFYISAQAWERYKVKVTWERNMDIKIDLYPDY